MSIGFELPFGWRVSGWQVSGWRVGRVCAGALLLFIGSVGGGSTGALAAGAGALPGAPSLSSGLTIDLLSDEDGALYQEIFALQKRGRWKQADKLIKQLNDKVLMGHVLYQRYMHATGYRSKYKELKAWLGQYADHPGAARVYKLALKRRPKGYRYPKKPLSRKYREAPDAAQANANRTGPSYSRSYRRAASKVRRMLRRERPTQALAYLNKKSVRRQLTQFDYDLLRQRVAGSYFIEDRNEKAYKVAAEVAARNGDVIPLANWYAGLAAWRLGDKKLAADHFSALATAPTTGNWSRAAGAFWAARAYLAVKQPEKVTPMLEIAADTGATFYGLMAARQLGRDIQFTWVHPPLDQAGHLSLMNYAPVRRAVALVEVGRRDLAETELLRAHGRIDASLDLALIALAERLKLPATQLQVANKVVVPSPQVSGPRGVVMNAGLFPVPHYAPDDGFRLDKALVYAFMRQESHFKPAAKSYAGARGLMQIMPATASHVRRDRSLRRSNRDKLFDPGLNLAIGQKYIEQLMGKGEPHGNLFMVTTAYNGGPGNLSRWLRNTDFRGDPLLFIESIPAPETRGYVERVLSNLWMYRDRLGQQTPSLDGAASGGWPVYQAMETPASPVAQR